MTYRSSRPFAVEVAQFGSHAPCASPLSLKAMPASRPISSKPPPAVVEEQEIAAHVIGHDDVGIPVIVDIAADGPHAGPSMGGDAGLPAHIGERPVAVVAVQYVRGIAIALAAVSREAR